MSARFRSSFAAPTGFVAAVTRAKPAAPSVARLVDATSPASIAEQKPAVRVAPRLAA